MENKLNSMLVRYMKYHGCEVRKREKYSLDMEHSDKKCIKETILTETHKNCERT